VNLTDAQFGQIENLLNCAIHEAVFALKHAADDQHDDALTCISQVQANAEAAADIIIYHTIEQRVEAQRQAGEL